MSMTKRGDDPYAAGWTACMTGQPTSSNPYELDYQRRLWLMGWQAAKEFTEARRRLA